MNSLISPEQNCEALQSPHQEIEHPAGVPGMHRPRPSASRDAFSLANAATEGVVIHQQGKIVDVNQAIIEMFGWPREDIIGHGVLAFVHPASRDLVRDHIHSGFDQPYEALGLKKGWGQIDLWVHGRPTLYQGLPARVVALRDITQEKRAQKKTQRLAQCRAVEIDRRRISRDMHDELGATLTHIKLLGEMVALEAARPEEVTRLGQLISAKARQLAGEMDEIVWAINPEKDHLENLAFYLGRYAEQFLALTDLRCRLDIPNVMPALSLPSPVRYRLLLAVKEALNNTVRHAGATEVWLSLSLEKDRLAIELKDDGCGFSTATRSGGGLGLANLQSGLAEIGGTCVIDSAPGQGTRVRLVVRAPARDSSV